MATRAELEAEWSSAATSGTLLTAKHDPNGLGTAWASYRTVLTPQVSASLEAFVKRIEGEGVKVTKPVSTNADGLKTAMIVDSLGNDVELIEGLAGK